jgi:ankyrin repeat protein
MQGVRTVEQLCIGQRANGDRQIVEMLIEFGADPAITNDRGQSPLDAARDKEHVSTL